MALTKGKYKVLLHLVGIKTSEDIFEVSYSLCQNGIARSVDLSRGQVSKLLMDLVQEGLVEESTRRVVGLKRRRKVYTLTIRGEKEAEEIRNELMEKKVKVKTESSTDTVALKDMVSRLDSREPLLTALKMLDPDDMIDLTTQRSETKDHFVGRERELSFLEAALENVKQTGKAETILVKGNAGIGKTRLVNEFKNMVLARNFDFLTGKGHHRGSEPYLVFKEAFSQLGDRYKPMEFGAEEERVRGEEGDAKANRYLMFSETTDNIKRLAKKRSLVIFLDDLQWADRASMMFFHYLSDNLRKSPVLLIAAYRPEDLRENDFISEVLRRMSRQHLFDEIELKSLNMEDTGEILQGLIGRKDIPNEFVHMIHQTSEGNPLFAKEFVKHMLDDGIVDSGENRFPREPDEIEMPRVVNDIIVSRISDLDRENMNILRVGSVIGERIPFPLLKEVSGLEIFDLMEYLDVLTGADIWHSDASEDNFFFTHGLIHSTVYDGVPAPLKKDMHRQVAVTMEGVYRDQVKDHYSDIGHHFKMGRVFEKGAEYYEKAGKKAEQVYAHEDAVEMYGEAMELACKAGLESMVWKISEDLGDVNKIIGRYDIALECYRRIPLDEVGSTHQQRIYRKIASVYEKLGKFDKSLEEIEKGLADGFDTSVETCRLLCIKGLDQMWLGDYGRSERSLLDALDLCGEFGGDREYAHVQRGLGTLYIYISKYEESLEYLNECITVYRRLNDIKGESAALNNLGAVYSDKGEWDTALEYYRESLNIRTKLGDERDIAAVLNNIGTVYSKKGKLRKAIEYYEKAHDTWEAIGDLRGIASSLLNIGVSYMDLGDLELALENQEKALEISKEINFKRGMATTMNNMGTIRAEMGDLAVAREYYEKSLDICKCIGYKHLQLHPMYGLTDILVLEERYDEALDTARELLKMAGNIGAKVEEASGHLIMGKAYRGKGDYEKAYEHLDLAKDMLEELGERRTMGELLYEYGLLEKEARDDLVWEELIYHARSIFQEMGMEQWVKRCEDVLRG